MTTYNQKTQDFIKALDTIAPKSLYQLENPGRDAGLIIVDIAPEHFVDQTRQSWVFCSLENSYPSDVFEKALSEAISTNKNLIVEVKSDIDNNFLAQIKEYTSRGLVTLNDKSAVLNPKEVKIVCIMHPEMEGQISYPYFTSMFGPVLRF